MPEAYIVDAVRTPGGEARRRAQPGAPGRPRRARAQGDRRPQRPRPDGRGGRRVRLRRPARPASGRHRATCWLAAGLPEAIPGTTVDRQCGSSQQAVHFAAQGVMSGTQDVVDRGRRAEHEHDPDRGRAHRRRAVRVRRPVLGLRGLGRALRHAGDLAVPRRRADRREVGHLARGHGGVRAREPRARDPCDRRSPLRARDRAARRRVDRRRSAARHVAREDGAAPDAHRGRPHHRRGGVADLRRRGRDARDVGARGEGPRRHAAGADPPPQRARRRPGAHAHRADPGDCATRSRRPA